VLRAYRALFVAAFQNAVQYRLQMLLWLLGNVMRPVIFLAAWIAVARARGGAVGGFTAGDFAAYYVCLSLVSQLTQAWDSWEFEQDIRLGRLSPKLLRPFHPIHYAVVDNLIWKVFTLPALLPVLALIAWSFGAHFQAAPWQIALFVPSVILGGALKFTFGWVLACLAFWTTRARSVTGLLERGAFLFAGQIAPLALLPGLLQPLAYALPFGYMLGVPADLLRGGPGLSTALALLAGQAIWLAVTLVAFQVVWRFGVRQYSAVGA
jgi:ABC-2 type transport system permease protein